MQRKLLNIYFYRTENQFKLRFIEMQMIEEPPQVHDEEVFGLLSGVEESFALALSNALDTFNRRYVRRNNLPQSSLFQRFCHSYDRKIVTDVDNPTLRYTFHNIDWLIFDLNNGDESDLMMQLGAIDEAIESFEKNALKDGYDVSIQYCNMPPDLDDEPEYVHNSFADAPVTHSTTALSRHIVNWIVSQSKSKSPEEQNFICSKLISLLESDENSLRNAVHQSIYLKPSSPPSPLPFLLFAHEIKAGNRHPENNELLYRQPTRP